MHPVRSLLVVAGLTIATAAAGAPSGGPGRLSFTGFSLVPPEGIQWVIKSDTPHPSIQALFIRDVGEERKRLSLEKRHSFVVMTTADVIPDLPYEDADKLLKRFTEDIKGGWQPGTLKSISVSISPRAADYAQGPFCVDYELAGNDEDRISGQSGKFFVMILRGKRCLHLLHPAYVVDLSYSQRSYHGTWITAFDKEVERFFNDLEFMPMPQLWPYVAEQLENYSYALLKVDNQAEARTVKTHAKRLKKPATGESVHLGFDPAADLEAYAVFLRSHGDLKGAQKMTILAKKWSDNNLLSFRMLQSKAALSADISETAKDQLYTCTTQVGGEALVAKVIVDITYGTVLLPRNYRTALTRCLARKYGWKKLGPPQWAEGTVRPPR